MGLNLCFEGICSKEQSLEEGVSRPVEALCLGYRDLYESEHDVLSFWDKLERDQTDIICQRCPLECNSNLLWKRYGCYPRVGSYGYVSSLYKYFENNYPDMLYNPFIQLFYPGGGFEKINKGEIGLYLKRCLDVRDSLKNKRCDSAVPYKNGYKIKSDSPYRKYKCIFATPSRDRYGEYNVMRYVDGCEIGVHYNNGIFVSYGNKPTWVTKTSNNKVKSLFSNNIDTDEIDHIEFEKSPAMWRFQHLFDVFEKIFKVALKHNLSVIEG